MKEKLKQIGIAVLIGFTILVVSVIIIIEREIPTKEEEEPAIEASEYLKDVTPPEGWDNDVFEHYYQLTRSAHYYDEFSVDMFLKIDNNFETIENFNNTGFTVMYNTMYCQNVYWVIGNAEYTDNDRIYGVIMTNENDQPFRLTYSDDDRPGVYSDMPITEFYQYMSKYHPHVWETSEDVKSNMLKVDDSFYTLYYEDTQYSQIWGIHIKDNLITSIEIVDSTMY